MELSKEEKEYIIQELSIELHAKPDGSGKNLIVPQCPYCGHEGGKYGIYIGKATERKKLFMAHCFSCGRSTQTLEQLLTDIGRQDLIITDTFDLDGDKKINDFSFLENDDREIDDSLCVVEMPEYYKRTHFNRYLRKRGFTEEDYDFFPVGTTRNMNFKFDDYVIFPIIDNGGIFPGIFGIKLILMNITVKQVIMENSKLCVIGIALKTILSNYYTTMIV